MRNMRKKAKSKAMASSNMSRPNLNNSNTSKPSHNSSVLSNPNTSKPGHNSTRSNLNASSRHMLSQRNGNRRGLSNLRDPSTQRKHNMGNRLNPNALSSSTHNQLSSNSMRRDRGMSSRRGMINDSPHSSIWTRTGTNLSKRVRLTRTGHTPSNSARSNSARCSNASNIPSGGSIAPITSTQNIAAGSSGAGTTAIASRTTTSTPTLAGGISSMSIACHS
jgi:hypothetical protein